MMETEKKWSYGASLALGFGISLAIWIAFGMAVLYFWGDL